MRARSWRRRAAVGAVALGGLVAVPVVGLPEYAATTNRLHCRTLGFMGQAAPRDCDARDVAEGERVAGEGGPLFSARERLGLHGFNHLLALGGVLVGLPEVARETVALSWAPSQLPANATTAERRNQCRASHDGVQAALAPARVWDNDLPMRSARVRARVAEGVAGLSMRSGATRSLGEVHFVQGPTNNGAYLGALRDDSLRAALALEVGDGRLTVKRRAAGRVDANWQGTIHYPGADTAFAIALPTLQGPRTLRVSETVFCGMHADGAMNPYALTYRWVLDPGDPRLDAEVGRSERGWLEEVGAGLVRAASVAGR